MSQRDPFETYRKRREIERLESEFQARAAEQKARLEEILSEEDDTDEIERKVTQEMQDFLSESTQTAERLLEDIYQDEAEAGMAQERLRTQIESFFAGITSKEDLRARRREKREKEQLAPPTPEPPPPDRRPPPVERRPLGKQETDRPEPLDLSAALERIRRHVKQPDGETPMPSRQPEPRPAPQQPSPAAEAPPAASPQVDEPQSFNEPSPFEGSFPSSAPGGLDLDDEPSPPPSFSPPPAMDHDFAPPPIDGGESDGGLPPGVTNVFESERGEDRDIDDDVDPDEPPGWNIPVRPPPPGAWVVEKQKEEGAAGLANVAGDTYLMKKLCQEVRSLNRLYQVLLDKGVVTREEVEGPDSKRAKPADDGDDDVVSVEDYTGEMYRPIETSDKEFSLSGLVKDVHRLKDLREVLVRKGVVSQKELEKAKG